jgi:hypothetical protein
VGFHVYFNAAGINARHSGHKISHDCGNFIEATGLRDAA